MAKGRRTWVGRERRLDRTVGLAVHGEWLDGWPSARIDAAIAILSFSRTDEKDMQIWGNIDSSLCRLRTKRFFLVLVLFIVPH